MELDRADGHTDSFSFSWQRRDQRQQPRRLRRALGRPHPSEQKPEAHAASALHVGPRIPQALLLALVPFVATLPLVCEAFRPHMRPVQHHPMRPSLSLRRSPLCPPPQMILNAQEFPLCYPPRFTVLGGGNFGLALAWLLGQKKIPTTILLRSQEYAECINTERRHPKYLSDARFPESVRATTDAADALKDVTHIVHAVPVQFSRATLNNISHLIPPNVPVLSVSKGIEANTLSLMSDILEETLGKNRSYAFLSGPSFAREIVRGLATGVVVASTDKRLARELQNILRGEMFQVFTSNDVIGVEIGGAVKNVLAIAAGMCEGLDLGTNAISGIVTSGAMEMRRFGRKMGAKASTFSGLSGAGDLFGTCFGPLSRNRAFGVRLGRGEKVEDILASSSEVAEGVATATALVELIKAKEGGYRIDLKYPIMFAIAEIISGHLTPREGLEEVMKGNSLVDMVYT
ncbi:unnamed protein product [Vitrella brassicaformis CCMP3155]|uniref:Glycerol-3-phosphate dehydrogenase [NAD(+)] n=1 Tax=Vitrella brassicaformis (strain CCMP3155) TaxID=1169540 RepID=A0A0G4EWL6_VITBC|nr:unnamed protein product [Vitrella brassicaformis CCMP3155]|eukprot:CEM03367.1 unnamed protein product [Vitrella brassicaformis CCMP3155]